MRHAIQLVYSVTKCEVPRRLRDSMTPLLFGKTFCELFALFLKFLWHDAAK